MINRGVFAGKTIFVTGSSRGIGKAIALKFAKDGANVVIAAKTIDPHPKLEGTIKQTAEEVNLAGGKGLAVQVDLRDEASIVRAVEETVNKFGGIDVLVNNASAIHLAPSSGVHVKKFDLMNSINVRGTYIMSKYAIPHLKKCSNPHIINMSPPIELSPQWFSNQTAYTMSKYGMSLAGYGLAAELQGEVAVNCLWPKTCIWTAAMNMLGGEETKKCSRKPDILADATYAIACRPKSTSGNFYIDEELLREEGVSDFEQYSIVPGAKLMPDFFLPPHVLAQFDADAMKIFANSISGMETKIEAEADKEPTTSGPIGSVFANASAIMTEEMKDDMNATLHFVISNADWTIVSKKGQPLEVKNEKPEKADVVMITDEATFVKMAKGDTKPTSAFMMGKLKIKGNMGLALKVEKLFVKMKAKL